MTAWSHPVTISLASVHGPLFSFPHFFNPLAVAFVWILMNWKYIYLQPRLSWAPKSYTQLSTWELQLSPSEQVKLEYPLPSFLVHTNSSWLFKPKPRSHLTSPILPFLVFNLLASQVVSLPYWNPNVPLLSPTKATPWPRPPHLLPDPPA